MTDFPQVTVYTDGACDPNPGPGGWAAILKFGSHVKELTGAEPETTNNRMELRAAVEALSALQQSCRVDLFTDSSYLQQGILDWLPNWQAKGWRTSDKTPVKNRDLWEQLADLKSKHQITWHWLKGHAGDPLNERADRLATAMIPSLKLPVVDSSFTNIFPGVSSNGQSGGWGVVIRLGEWVEEFSGFVPQTTSNQLLLVATLAGLKNASAERPIRVYTAAEYLYRGATQWVTRWQSNGWRTKEGALVKNKENWQALIENGRGVHWQFVKGEMPSELIRAAELATEALRNSRQTKYAKGDSYA